MVSDGLWLLSAQTGELLRHRTKAQAMERVNKMLNSAGSSVRAKMEAAAAVRAGLTAAAEADAIRPWPFPQGEAPFPQGVAGVGDATPAAKAMATAEEAMAMSERTLELSESVSAGAALVLRAGAPKTSEEHLPHAPASAAAEIVRPVGARDGACARYGAQPAGKEEERLDQLQSENEALHEAVEAARHACACLRFGGLSAVPSKGAVSSTAHAEPERSNVLGREGARYGAPLGRGGARDGAGARPRYDGARSAAGAIGAWDGGAQLGIRARGAAGVICRRARRRRSAAVDAFAHALAHSRAAISVPVTTVPVPVPLASADRVEMWSVEGQDLNPRSLYLIWRTRLNEFFAMGTRKGATIFQPELASSKHLGLCDLPQLVGRHGRRSSNGPNLTGAILRRRRRGASTSSAAHPRKITIAN